MATNYIRCIICGARPNGSEQIRFHKFPSQKRRRYNWLLKINRPDLIDSILSEDERICAKHFSAEMFCRSANILKLSAIPDQNLQSEDERLIPPDDSATTTMSMSISVPENKQQHTIGGVHVENVNEPLETNICRLCLAVLSERSSVFLFDNKAHENELLALIAKYLDLKLLPDDSVSTRICQTCCLHLETFHQFQQNVLRQQSTLRNEFFALSIVKNEVEIKTEVEMAEETLFEQTEMDAGFEQIDSIGVEAFTACSTSDLAEESKGCDSMDVLRCDLCGLKYIKEKSLKLHILAKHTTERMTDQYLAAVDDPESGTCNECGRECPNKKALRTHIDFVHKKEKHHTCTYCKKTFRHPSVLADHMATHTGAKQYKCPHCGKECRFKNNMYAHIKSFHYQDWLELKPKRSENRRFAKTE